MKKRRLWGLFCIGCFVFLFMSVNTKAATPVQKWGQLKVSGTNIVDKTGMLLVDGPLKGLLARGVIVVDGAGKVLLSVPDCSPLRVRWPPGIRGLPLLYLSLSPP